MYEIRRTVPTRERMRQSQIAADFFTRASGQYPAFMAPQSARIAQLCRESELPPGQIGLFLVRDRRRISELVDTAIKVHESVGAQVTDVTEGRVTGIVRKEFTFAHAMKQTLSPEEISDLLSEYPTFKAMFADKEGDERVAHHFRADQLYNERARNLIHSRQRRPSILP